MATTAGLDLDNIQGDILEGLAKKHEAFVFFYITNPTHFRHSLQSLIPLITTTTQALADQDAIKDHKDKGHTGLIKLVGTNIAFSQAGLYALGILDNLNDPIFAAGQLADASKNFAADGLADPGIVTGVHIDPAWDPVFKQVIHGCILITGDCDATVHEREKDIAHILGGTIKRLETVYGAVRPGSESGHEHFGFQDGLSQPPINGFRNPNTGEDPTPPGVILLGESGDNVVRPAWTKDSSFLVFRKLRQYVPEFNNFLDSNPIPDKNLTPEKGSELLGARLVGRWKSGTPIDRHPTEDVPSEATDPNLVNDFDYQDDPAQVRCPFTAHLRKMNPRAGAIPGLVPTRSRRIIRQGIPYGPEVDTIEESAKSTLHDRGLLFVCYQSNLSLGFHFLQRNWADNPGFPNAGNGFDPLIGQDVNAPRFIAGTDPENVATSLALPNGLFVFPLGGEYFLSPSISALKTKIAA
jgi:Dyp-type peroxidase family